MKNSVIIIAIFSLLISMNSFAQDKCREMVVRAYSSIGEQIAPESFSNSTFEELNITFDEFNALAPEEQSKIYMKIKPLSVMVEQTIGALNQYINRYAGSVYEFYFLDELEAWRTSRDNLRACAK